MSQIKIALADDHKVVTTSLTAYLHSFEDLEVVGVAPSGEALLASIGKWRPDVLLLDLLMPGGIDGVETARRMQQIAPGVRIIALTASMDEARMMAVLRAGASGYVRKDADPEVLIDAIRAVAHGRTFIDPAAAPRSDATAEKGHDLTARESDVLRQLARGLSNRDIAGALGISDETVKSHVASILGKLRVDSRSHAIVYALKAGFGE